MFPDGTNRLLAPILAHDARIVQIEPDPSYSLDRISRHYNVELVQKGVWVNSGVATLYITRDPYKSSILEPNSTIISQNFLHEDNQYEVVRTVPVDCVTIADVIAKYSLGTDIWLKIDAQGVEGHIISSMAAELSTVKVILVELSSIEQYRGQMLSQQVIAELFCAGFRLFFANYKNSAPYENDFIFIRPNDLSSKDMMHLHLLVGNAGHALRMAPSILVQMQLRGLLAVNALVKTILRTGIYTRLQALVRPKLKS
jgi:FkbM family methyltransferase